MKIRGTLWKVALIKKKHITFCEVSIRVFDEKIINKQKVGQVLIALQGEEDHEANQNSI